MKHVTISTLVDTRCMVTFVLSLFSGLVLYLVLSSEGGWESSRADYLGVIRFDWVNLHTYASLAFAALGYPGSGDFH